MTRAGVVALVGLALAGCKGEPERSDPGPVVASEPDAKPTAKPPTPTPASTIPSCAVARPGAGQACGPERDADCCAHAGVPGGSFKRAYDGINCKDAGYPASVGDFELDVYEVTVGRFRAFLDAGQGTRERPPAPGAGAHPRAPASGWDPAWNEALAESRAALEGKLACAPQASWTATPGEGETLPINCLTFYEAMAFCAWDGGFLPTEAERNYAASGGDEQRLYPWSSPPDSPHTSPEHAVFGSPGTAPVGTHRAGDGRWGHADLAGNVWEWTLDAVELAKVLPTEGANYCEPAGMPTPCTDCVATEAGSARVLRGGGWGLPERGMAVSIRRGGEPDQRDHVFGVRCARPYAGVAGAAADPSDCEPSCEARVCGDDRCGGSCGSCDGPQKQACVDGRCELVSYPSGPFGLELGATVPDLHLSAIEDAANPEAIRELAIAEFHMPGELHAPPLAIYFATGWAQPDPTPELVAWTAKRGMKVLVILLEGDRRGQPADAGNLQTFGVEQGLSMPVAMDTHGTLAAVWRGKPRPWLVIVDPATMVVRAVSDLQVDPPWAQPTER